MQYNSTTTLNLIRAASPCRDGWLKLLNYIGKTKADDEPLSLLTILDSNGFDDALWVLSYAMSDDRLGRHFQAWCAEQVLHIYERAYPNDARIRDQIAMLRNGDATQEERTAAWTAARDAAWATAWDAGCDVKWDAARVIALAAASDASVALAPDLGAELDTARAAQGQQLRKMLAEGKQ